MKLRAYDLSIGPLPAVAHGVYSMPTEQTMAAMAVLDRRVQRTWLVLMAEAGRGHFGPFTGEDVAAAAAANFPSDAVRLPPGASVQEPLTATEADAGLLALYALQLVYPTDL